MITKATGTRSLFSFEQAWNHIKEKIWQKIRGKMLFFSYQKKYISAIITDTNQKKHAYLLFIELFKNHLQIHPLNQKLSKFQGYKDNIFNDLEYICLRNSLTHNREKDLDSTTHSTPWFGPFWRYAHILGQHR